MPSRPNIVFIMPDQLRPDFLSCYDAAFIDTPNIDALAQEGVLFSRAYSPHPLCVPARCSLLTGMHALKTGVLDNGLFLRPDLEACGIKTWPQLLSENGYYTAAIGKMHFYPWDLRLGFQYRVIAEDKRWIHIRDDYYHYLAARGLRKYHGNEHEGYYENKGAIINRLPWEHQVDHFVGQEACRFIREHGQEGPFAMMVGFPGPHCPYDPDPRYLEGFDPADMPPAVPTVETDLARVRQNNIDGARQPWNGVDHSEFTPAQKAKVRAHYAALVRQIDEQVGAILDTLREDGLLENTVIIFGADHGDYLGDHGLTGKGTFYESSIHIPLIVRPAQATSVRDSSELVSLTDVTATILGLAGVTVPEACDSIPLPEIGLEREQQHERIIGAVSGGWMIDDGQFRLAKYATGEHVLFDHKEDPLEQHNLIDSPAHQGILRSLDAELTTSVMNATQEAVHERRVYVRDLSQMPAFGREGWQRPYPRRIDDR